MTLLVQRETKHHFLKWFSLCLLIVQSCAWVLVMRYSRTVKVNGPRYLSSTAILLAEFLKLLICIVIVFIKSNASFVETYKTINRDIFHNVRDTLKLAVPAGLYVAQNNLLFVALSHLDAATYMVTYQLRILTTALFSVFMLSRHLSLLKWFSLLILMAGTALAQLSTSGVQSMSKSSHKASSSFWNHMLGLGAVFGACVTSGFACVYFERILKGTPPSIWMRNIQLGAFGTIIAMLTVFSYDVKAVMSDGFFQGYNKWTVFVVFLQAFGGLIIAAVINYADNILKGFAASITCIPAALISYYIFEDFVPSAHFVGGAALVGVATLLYSYEPKPQSRGVSPSSSSRIVSMASHVDGDGADNDDEVPLVVVTSTDVTTANGDVDASENT